MLFFYVIDMIQIDNTLISLDLLDQFFICDLGKCKGDCCVEGDAGAPLTDEEFELLRELLPVVWDDLSPKAKAVIKADDVGYRDDDGEMVTSIVDGKDCVFTYYDGDGICKCAIEKAYREGKTSFYKPISCHLYPIRLAEYDSYTAVNYHRWQICKVAEVLGKKEDVRVFQFLKEPLIRRFGQEWYDALCECYEELSRQGRI